MEWGVPSHEMGCLWGGVQARVFWLQPQAHVLMHMHMHMHMHVHVHMH